MLRSPRLSVCLAASLVVLSLVASARAEDTSGSTAFEAGELAASPVTREMNRHYYARLYRDPWRALGWEALAPGAGSLYTGLRPHALVTLGVSLLGAGLWIAGAVVDDDGLWWAGAGTFAAGRSYGLVAAPLGAHLLNAAFRRQLGIAYRF